MQYARKLVRASVGPPPADPLPFPDGLRRDPPLTDLTAAADNLPIPAGG
jgi:hypothetical protein